MIKCFRSYSTTNGFSSNKFASNASGLIGIAIFVREVDLSSPKNLFKKKWRFLADWFLGQTYILGTLYTFDIGKIFKKSFEKNDTFNMAWKQGHATFF